jgi:hypothetical protein
MELYQPANGLVFEWLSAENVVVSYMGTGPAARHEWDSYRNLLQAIQHTRRVRCLWYTEGAYPPRDEQVRLAEAGGRQPWLAAVVSPSPALRFVVSAVSLINRNLRYFTPQDLPKALVHLRCTATEQEAVLDALDRLKQAHQEPAPPPDMSHAIEVLRQYRSDREAGRRSH